MALLTTLILSILSLILIPSSSLANENNILVTGDVLPTDGQLSYNDAVFVMQGDCNLVLYRNGNGFQSNTHGLGRSCTLTLSDYGQLIIKSGDGSLVWTSPGGNIKGKYVAVLGPDGWVNVFGPSIWSTTAHYSSSAAIDSELNNVPLVRNVLFSSQILDGNTYLASRDYTFEITNDCNVEFKKGGKVVWESETKGNGQYCFVRINKRGQLAVVDDNYNLLWQSTPVGADGNYILVVEIQGQATIYGPVVWSTGPASFADRISLSV